MPTTRHTTSLIARVALGTCIATVVLSPAPVAAQDAPPNILFAIADDWGWPHASAYGDPVVETPVFDRIASEGALAHHAYVSSPSCTPSRGAILTGQWHWRLEGAANLWSIFPYAATRDELAERLLDRLRETGDPRASGDGDALEDHPYLGSAPRHPSLPRPQRNASGRPPAQR